MRNFNGVRFSLSLTAVLVAAGWLFAISEPAADIIHFKDGSKTVCRDRAWEQDAQVFCEFYGLSVAYPRQDVKRIEKTVSTGTGDSAPDSEGAAKSAPPSPEPDPNSAPPPAAKVGAKAAEGERGGLSGEASLPFYDPRREKKYRSSPTGRHRTFQEAIDALAREFGRSPNWVEANMGNSNVLAEIRDRLAAAAAADASRPPKTAAEVTPAFADLAGVAFYDPRRPHKYWISMDSRHDTLKGALEALSRRFDRPVDWVKANMGETNDLGEIYRNLSAATRQ